VEFWKSGKNSLIFKYRHVFARLNSCNSYIGRKRVEKKTNADKFSFITEYVLQKFEEACNRKSIIHDMNLRLWTLEAKDQIDLSEFKASK